jgi:predicted AAA+ superfamily ATPase
MTTYKIVVVDLRSYRVERVDSGGFKSVRSFATYEEAQSCVDQDRIFETKAAQAKRAELGRLAAALTVRATAARKRAEAAVERSARTRGLVAQACQHAETRAIWSHNQALEHFQSD